MRLLLIRHADAGDRDPALWPDDRDRPLTDRGRKRHRRVARRLRRAGLVPTLLLASPWRRAWQTAEFTAELTGAPAPVVTEALASPPDLKRIAAAIGRQTPEAIVGLVGHEPWLGELASVLLTGDTGTLTVDFPKSGVLGLSAGACSAGDAVLEFMWRPKRS